MCGIAGLFFRESVPDSEYISEFLAATTKRGSDGFGAVQCGVKFISKPERYADIIRLPKFDTTAVDEFVENANLRIGNVLLCNARSAPETETGVASENDIQPIVYNQYVLVHNGSVSNRIVREMREKHSFATNIDSEAIIHAYIENNCNMSETMRYLSGGFAFMLYDGNKNQLYVVTTHAPLYLGYLRGMGFMCHSEIGPIMKLISHCVGNNVERCGMNLWEHYYFHEHKPNTITSIDLDSGMTFEDKFPPRYIHPKFDNYNGNSVTNECVLVAASGGLDSSTTLAVLKKCDMNPIAVHFNYGQRGADAEMNSVKQVTTHLGVELVTFDISGVMRQIDPDSMLMDSAAEITTGTVDGVKTLAAWTCARNLLFVTHMIAYAESLVVNSKARMVGISLGINLTEEGVYPDNGKRFLESCMKSAQFGSMCGSRIYPVYGLANLLKSEQMVLLKHMNLLDIIPMTISCDRPRTVDEIDDRGFVIGTKSLACGRYENGEWIPKCGSGKLAYWAGIITGIPDTRYYYEAPDADSYDDYKPEGLRRRIFDVMQIINKIELPDSVKQLLR